MLRIAVPNKGSLSEPAITMLTEAGYQLHRRGRELVISDHTNDVEFFFLRPRDIAVHVGHGTIHVGITGRDLLRDSPSGAVEHRARGFARSTFRFAGPAGEFTSLEDIQGRRIATSYDKLVRDYLNEAGIDAEVVHLDGAVESSVRLGVADLIADVVETGGTLRAAGLEVFGDPLMQSEALLIAREDMRDNAALATLDRRLEGVLVARSYVLVDYNVRERDLNAAIAITPGLNSPTISPLMNTEWLAVRVMVKAENINSVMDRLYAEGARAIIVTKLAASRI